MSGLGQALLPPAALGLHLILAHLPDDECALLHLRPHVGELLLLGRGIKLLPLGNSRWGTLIGFSIAKT